MQASLTWTAFCFGYYETLAALRDPSIWQREKIRLAEKNGLLRRSEYDETLWEDWVEETEELFGELAKTKTEDEALHIIEAVFNDQARSMAILTHFRVRSAPLVSSQLTFQFLISLWMKEEGHRYESYLPDMSIDAYRQSFETAYSEMDEVSLRAAYDMLLDEGGVSLEVAYLDRSIGEKITPHVYLPSNESHRIGTMHFLYRP